MVRLALRVVGRAIFGDDVARAGDVLDSAFPVLNRHTFRRAMSPLAPPASWPTPDNRRAARARRALRGVVDKLIAHRRQTGANGDDLLSRLLRARDPDTGEPMAVQQVRDEALIFLLHRGLPRCRVHARPPRPSVVKRRAGRLRYGNARASRRGGPADRARRWRRSPRPA
jgi:hypothetical protein